MARRESLCKPSADAAGTTDILAPFQKTLSARHSDHELLVQITSIESAYIAADQARLRQCR
jgi:hypothetical protein